MASFRAFFKLIFFIFGKETGLSQKSRNVILNKVKNHLLNSIAEILRRFATQNDILIMF